MNSELLEVLMASACRRRSSTPSGVCAPDSADNARARQAQAVSQIERLPRMADTGAMPGKWRIRSVALATTCAQRPAERRHLACAFARRTFPRGLLPQLAAGSEQRRRRL